MKRIVSLILLFEFIIIQLPLGIENASGQTYDEIWNDVHIYNSIAIDNRTILCNGNITIGFGASLKISDCFLIMNPHANNSIFIEVNRNGGLEIQNSELKSNTSFGYNITIRENAECTIKESTIMNISSFCLTDICPPGILVENGKLSLSNSILYTAGNGIWGDNSIIDFTNNIAYPAYNGGALFGIPPENQFLISNSFLLLRNCESDIRNSTFVGAISDYPFEDAATGILVSGTKNTCTITNSTFSNCVCIVSQNAQISDSIFNRSHIDMSQYRQKFENCRIKNNISYAVEIIGDEALFINSTVQGNKTDIILGDFAGKADDRAVVNFINSSYPRYEIENDLDVLNISNFLSVNVIGEKDMKGLEDADISIVDAQQKNVYDGKTDSDGDVNNIVIKYKSIYLNGIVDYSPIEVIAKKGNIEKAVSNINMSTNQNIKIILDNIPPNLNITSPPDGFMTNSSIISIVGTAEPGARVTVNNVTINNLNGVINQTWWLDEGLNTLVIRAQDQAGNVVEINRNVTLKTVGPSIRISEPRDGAVTNQHPITIKGATNGTRAEIDSQPVQLEINGSFSYNYSFQVEGLHTIIATAWDEVNNSGFARVRVEYDITPPEIEITSPSNGSRTNLNSVDVIGRITGAANATMNGQKLQIDPEGAFSKTIQLVEGWNEIVIQAQDIAGNRNSTSVRVFLDTKIGLNITLPADGILINVSSITIQGISDIDAVITIGNLSVENVAGKFSQLIQLTEGLNRVTVSSVDLAGNRAERTVRITVDTIPPPINILSPLEETVKVQNLELRVRSEAGAIVMVNGVQVNGTGDLFLYTGLLQEGENRFTITARDAAGNMNTTEKTLTYTPQKKPKPPVNSDNGLLLPIVIIIVITVLVIFAYIYVRKKPTKTPSMTFEKQK